MAKTKIREVSIRESGGTFKFLKGKEKYDFDGLSSLRQILSKEKAKVLDTKALTDDIKLLERFGFIELIKEKVNGRIRHRPKIVVNEIVIKLKI